MVIQIFSYWNRKLLIFISQFLDEHENSALISTIKKLYSGYINEARVQLGKFEDFITTSCITSLTFLENIHES
jgi:hypothetical protein